MKLINWLNKELDKYFNCWNGDGRDLIVEICIKNNYDKKKCLEVIEDALWYSTDDFLRIHRRNEVKENETT